jgi:uncharacterized membrane protein YbhN (UPF0104 family)
MKRAYGTILRSVVLALILAFGAFYLSRHFHTYARGATFTVGNVLLLAALNLCTIACESTRLRIILRKLGKDVGPVVSWHLMTLMQAANHVVLKAGTLSGGYYISKRYGISFNSYLAFVITYVVMIVMGAGVFGLAVTAGFLLAGSEVHPFVAVFFGAVILASAGLILIARIRLPLGRFPSVVVKFLESVRTIYSDTGMLGILLIVECVYCLTTSLRFMVAVTLFSGHTGFVESVVVVTVGNFLRIATVIPGGIGIAEAGTAWMFGLMGDDAVLAGLSAGLDRLMYILLVMVFGGIGFFSITNRGEFRRPKEEVSP